MDIRLFCCIFILSQIQFVTTEVTCGDPPDVQFAYRIVNTSTDATSTAIGSVWYYQCFERYIPIGGDAYRTCNPSSIWQGDNLDCRAASCKSLPRPDHGLVTFLSVNIGSVASYICFEGYMFGFGDIQRTCQSDGTYSGIAPTCDIISCTVPDNIAKSLIQFDLNNPYNSWVTYTCYPGYYSRTGDLQRRCTADATWSGNLPFCEVVMCPFPTKPDRARPSFTGLGWKDTLSYECEYGTSLASGNLTRSCSDDATWSGSEAVCEDIRCSQTPEVGNASSSYTGSDAGFGTIAYYKCNHGYITVGGVTFCKCQRDGTWTEIDLDCVGVYCGEAPLYIGAKNNVTGEMYEDKAIYECYIQLDNVVETWIISCNREGKWQGIEPECTAGWYDKKFKPDPVEAPGAAGIGIVVFAIFITIIIAIIVLDVATLHHHFVYLRRNLKHFRKTLRIKCRILKANRHLVKFVNRLRMKKWDEKRLTTITPYQPEPLQKCLTEVSVI